MGSGGGMEVLSLPELTRFSPTLVMGLLQIIRSPFFSKFGILRRFQLLASVNAVNAGAKA